MTHSFSVKAASEYGLNEAIILNNLRYWIAHNAANEKNFYDGRYWTYNSNAAFCKLFPYLSEKKIRNALKHLQEEGIIITGNYNKSAYDRTLWYAFTEKGASIFLSENEEYVPIQTKSQMDSTETGEPIPVNYSGKQNYNIPPNPQGEEPNGSECEDVVTTLEEDKRNPDHEYCKTVMDLYNATCKNLLRAKKVTVKRKRAVKKAKKDIEEFGGWEKYFSCVTSRPFLNGKNKDGWKADFDWLLKPDKMLNIMEGKYNTQANCNYSYRNEPESLKQKYEEQARRDKERIESGEYVPAPWEE